MGLSLPHLLLLLIVILILFGAGRLPKVMEDLGKGLKSFKNAMGDNPADKPVKTDSKISEASLPTSTTTVTTENKDV